MKLAIEVAIGVVTIAMAMLAMATAINLTRRSRLR
jgi:hypothetical protein